MIEIFLSEDYDKYLLKEELKWIKETASRELTYDVDISKDLDVLINPYEGYNEGTVQEMSSCTWNRDNVLVLISDTWIHEYINGKKLGVDSMEDYVKEM